MLRLSLAACALAIGVASTRAAEPGPAEVIGSPPIEARAAITLDEAEQIALGNNPTLAQAAAKLRGAQGKARQAGLYPNPTLGYIAEQIGAAGTAGEMHGIFVQQEVVTAGKLSLSRAKYVREIAEARWQLRAQEARVRFSTNLAFFEALAAQRQRDIRKQLVSNAQNALETTSELVNVGQANRPDLLQARIEAQRANVALRVAENHLRRSWTELAAVIGSPDMHAMDIDGKLELANHELLDFDSTLAVLLEQHPLIQVALIEVSRDRLAVQRERVEPIPNLNLRGETGYNFETDNAVAGFSVGVRLPIYDRNQGAITQAQAELARAQAEVGRIELLLRKEFADAYSRYASALEMARTYREESLPLAKEAYELYLDSFRNRRAAWPQVLTAQREWMRLNEDYIHSLLEARRALAEINGQFLGDGLTEPPGPTPQGHREATPRPR